MNLHRASSELTFALMRLVQTLPELAVAEDSVTAEVISAPGWKRRCVGARLHDGKAVVRVPEKLLDLEWPARLEWLTHGLVHASLQLASGRIDTPYRHPKVFAETCNRIGLATERRPHRDHRHVGATDVLFLRLVRLAAQLSLQGSEPAAPPVKTYRCHCGHSVSSAADLLVRCLDCDHILEIQP